MSKVKGVLKKIATPAGILHPSGAIFGKLDPANALSKNMQPGLMRGIINPASGLKGGNNDPRKKKRQAAILSGSNDDSTGQSLLS